MEYKNIKIFRDKKRDDELEQLSDEKKDFEFRRLFIEETNKTLHVISSRATIFELMSIVSLLFIPLQIFNNPKIGLYILSYSIICKILSKLFINQYNKVLDGFKVGLAIVDHVIYKDYNVSLS